MNKKSQYDEILCLANEYKKLNSVEKIKIKLNEMGWKIFLLEMRTDYLAYTDSKTKSIILNFNKKEEIEKIDQYLFYHEFYHALNNETSALSSDILENNSNYKLEWADIFAYTMSSDLSPAFIKQKLDGIHK